MDILFGIFQILFATYGKHNLVNTFGGGTPLFSQANCDKLAVHFANCNIPHLWRSQTNCLGQLASLKDQKQPNFHSPVKKIGKPLPRKLTNGKQPACDVKNKNLTFLSTGSWKVFESFYVSLWLTNYPQRIITTGTGDYGQAQTKVREITFLSISVSCMAAKSSNEVATFACPHFSTFPDFRLDSQVWLVPCMKLSCLSRFYWLSRLRTCRCHFLQFTLKSVTALNSLKTKTNWSMLCNGGLLFCCCNAL